MGTCPVHNHIKAVVGAQFSSRAGWGWCFSSDVMCSVGALRAALGGGRTPDAELPKANCCLGWGTTSFTHLCNLSTWVVSSPLSPKHHTIFLVLMLTSSDSSRWRMRAGGKSVYNSLIDQFQFCSHLPVLWTLFLRENNYMGSGFSRGLLWFMWGTDKDLSHQEGEMGWGKEAFFPCNK